MASINSTIALLSVFNAQFNVEKGNCGIVNSTYVTDVILAIMHREGLQRYCIFYSRPLTDLYSDVQNRLIEKFSTAPHAIFNDKKLQFSHHPINKNILAIILITSFKDYVFRIIKNNWSGMRNYRLVIIMNPLENCGYFDTNSIQNHYNWMWQQKIQRVVLITSNNNVHAQDAYYLYRVRNITENWQNASFYTSYKKLNVDGHLYKCYIRYDLPNLFIEPHFIKSSNGLEGISGTTGLMIKNILERVNATVTLNVTRESYKLPNKNTKDIKDQLNNEDIEISLNEMLAIPPIPNHISLAINSLCIMTPGKGLMPESEIFLYSIQAQYFILLLWLSMCILFVHRFLNANQLPFDWFLMILSTMCGTLNLAQPLKA